MSNVKIITYVLSKPERDHEDLIKAIKNYETWEKITEFTWIVATNNSCINIMNILKKHLHSNDRMFVAELTGISAWKNILCKT
ncbi:MULTISPECIES: CRISPR-associated protein Cas2 [Bacillus]|uniref:CRISPR-associated protein Cas2 n=1 Tax=Bacillus TaxID=1386 RepID=UPI000BECB188|nr:CRISPR-associated protein Cas2 [Bacillus toyonensis]PEA63670.1 CRISPR-associated protein Cas2 [Bacillus toyonensis]PEC38844.1 CRISPR-associated protein Cas2 [Bacillus toyonensis]PED17064.1 CRISPR-associated protein Cas2 [Bacillus toyonensis]PED58909.1 CRISPR-associated protein Cas2 [Bacillus toyonensis]PEJ99073.1 CRISPR-associated protein Cas2 [Bacillus toyonensis]